MRAMAYTVVVAFAAVVVLALGCEEATVTQVEETGGKLEFIVGAYSYERPTTPGLPPDWEGAQVVVSCPIYPYPLPSVTVNGATPSETGVLLGGIRYRTEPLPYRSQVSYTIAWQSDTLSGGFVIPHVVDSVYCNGVALPYRVPEADQYDTIPNASVYCFRWYCRGAPYYHFDMEYTLATDSNWKAMDVVQVQDSLCVSATQEGGEINQMRITISPLADSLYDFERGMAGVESGRLCCYEGVYGGWYRARLSCVGL